MELSAREAQSAQQMLAELEWQQDETPAGPLAELWVEWSAKLRELLTG